LNDTHKCTFEFLIFLLCNCFVATVRIIFNLTYGIANNTLY